MLDPSDPPHWSVEDVVRWALKLGIDSDDAAKLKRQKITGAHLRELTKAEMVTLYGISGAAQVTL